MGKKSKEKQERSNENDSDSDSSLHLPEDIFNDDESFKEIDSDEMSETELPLKQDNRVKKSVSFMERQSSSSSSDDEEPQAPAQNKNVPGNDLSDSDIYSESDGNQAETNAKTTLPPETPAQRERSPTPTFNEIHKFSAVTPAPTISKKRVREAKLRDFTVYLIRKPKELTLDEIKKLKLSSDPSTAKRKIKTESGKWECDISTHNPQILHIPMETNESSFSAQNLVTHSITLKRSANDEILPAFEDLPLKSIKREPTREGWDELRERAIAFGVRRKKRKSLSGHKFRKTASTA